MRKKLKELWVRLLLFLGLVPLDQHRREIEGLEEALGNLRKEKIKLSAEALSLRRAADIVARVESAAKLCADGAHTDIYETKAFLESLFEYFGGSERLHFSDDDAVPGSISIGVSSVKSDGETWVHLASKALVMEGMTESIDAEKTVGGKLRKCLWILGQCGQLTMMMETLARNNGVRFHLTFNRPKNAYELYCEVDVKTHSNDSILILDEKCLDDEEEEEAERNDG